MSSARDLVTRYLVHHAGEVERSGRSVADGDPEGTHDLRVACRRARAALRSYRRLLRPAGRAGAADLAGDLRQLGLDLSGPRDDEVVRSLVRAWASEGCWPPEVLAELLDVLGPTGSSPVSASTVAVRASSLGTAVRTWVAHADWRRHAGADAGDVMAPVVRRAAGRLARRVDVAIGAVGPATEGENRAGEAPQPWHEVRKAAKRLRYTAEAALPALPACEAVVGAAKSLQTVLGDRRDAQLVLLRLAGLPGPASTAVLLATERARRAVRERGDAAPVAYQDLRQAVARLP